MKAFLRSSHECMDSRAKLSSHVRGAGSKAIGLAAFLKSSHEHFFPSNVFECYLHLSGLIV